VTTHRSLARAPHDRELRLAAKRALKYPAVHFTPPQVRSIARGFARAIAESGYIMYACAIMPDHAHLVVGRHERTAEKITSHLKSFSTRQLRADQLHPSERFARPNGSVPEAWAEGLWKVFLFTPQDVERAIRYVENNPPREGLPHQNWEFVLPYLLV
jgi:REP element-mobilizing transposase RayT